ncbi:MAG: multicopper oxidase family protein, partial [Halalkalicoccus sp.]|nr:multicopper oxidase family protein [Halalkalicoccus sp.]
MSALAGCSTLDGMTPDSEPELASPRSPPSEPADTTARLRATVGTAQPSEDAATETWLYNDGFPGPELRAREGEVVEVELTNDLRDETTIHWHGIPLSNGMDGVPNVTQDPIESRGSFTYKFRAEPAGTFFYHSHVGLQLDRGLLAPLVIEEAEPHIEYDREYTVVLDDYLDGEPRPLSDTDSNGEAGGGMGGGPGGMGGMMDDRRPDYAGLLVNGRLPENPPSFALREGERVRFRFINASSATAFGVRVAGHPLTVTHADGRPVEPVTVDSFSVGSGERYDAIVDAENPGTWELRAAALD